MLALKTFVRAFSTGQALNKVALIRNGSLLRAPKICQQTTKRHSGHNVMNIEPSNFHWKYFKDMAHFYFLLGGVPTLVVATIINIRANPELTEIPEGYEPRHWEYYKHPVTRFMAKYLFVPMETEHEMNLAFADGESESVIMRNIQRKVEKTISFYNDHRTIFFRPSFADNFRRNRDESMYGVPHMMTNEGHFLDHAYDPKITPVPVEGYPPTE